MGIRHNEEESHKCCELQIRITRRHYHHNYPMAGGGCCNKAEVFIFNHQFTENTAMNSLGELQLCAFVHLSTAVAQYSNTSFTSNRIDSVQKQLTRKLEPLYPWGSPTLSTAWPHIYFNFHYNTWPREVTEPTLASNYSLFNSIKKHCRQSRQLLSICNVYLLILLARKTHES